MSALVQEHLESYIDYPIDQVKPLQEKLHQLHLSRKCQPYAYRMHYLKQIGYLLQDNAEAICESVKKDLGRNRDEVSFTEVWTSVREVDLTVKRLKGWMQDETAFWDTILAFKGNNPRVKKQPKGVVLAIGPWNYPWYLNIGPLIGAVAAGCPIVIKPSEHSKHSSLLLSQLVHKYMDNEAHHVVLGAVEHSTKLLDLRWGHVFFTGSTGVGKIVAQATAKNLVPCTLELGGKSPVILTKSTNFKIAAKRILSMKAYGAGQMCTNADYVLCPKEHADDFVKACEDALREFYPRNGSKSILDSEATSQLVHKPHFDRITKFIEQAKADGHYVIGGESDEERRKVGLTCVKIYADKESTGGLMTEEIFGPILPIISVQDVDAAIEYVNARPTPLALYVFSEKRKDFEYVIERTLSGGACWNDVSIQTVQRGLPFGGVGESGWGSGHGKNAYETFTHRRATVDVPSNLEPFMRLRYPNAPKWGMKVFEALIGHKLSFARSTSVAAETKREKSRERIRKFIKYLIGLVFLLLAKRLRG
ncbi:Aldehyde/histidinol dehydrogenase [Filobasidium floriforme]|uniref:Aldehyde/histidinol dehydrogenase n=1 Tax=Filobasidium floriforme TaxID=5210 RepID=UPI001E8E5B83|nr:Aldehyde/histidinol dehydrogenase [Filobasidium floriforme]KAH8089211.1 Aldehyde/histidinol dehydrogenase [Filobasidium floriforme]